MPSPRLSRPAAAVRALLIASAVTLAIYLLFGVAAPHALSALLGSRLLVQDETGLLSWGLLIAAPLCGAVFLTLAWVLYDRYTSREP